MVSQEKDSTARDFGRFFFNSTGTFIRELRVCDYWCLAIQMISLKKIVKTQTSLQFLTIERIKCQHFSFEFVCVQVKTTSIPEPCQTRQEQGHKIGCIFPGKTDMAAFLRVPMPQSCPGKRLLNDWRHSWCTYDVFVGVRMTSLPVFSQTFGYPTLVLWQNNTCRIIMKYVWWFGQGFKAETHLICKDHCLRALSAYKSTLVDWVVVCGTPKGPL